jgi:hypothetical protein
MEYKILKEDDISKIEDSIQKSINDGWFPYGYLQAVLSKIGANAVYSSYIQPMIKKESLDEYNFDSELPN